MYFANKMPFTVGINTSSFNTIYAAQERSMYCWAACIQMILRKHGIMVSQSELAQLTCGVDRYGVPNNCPASSYTITQYLNTCWLDSVQEYCLSTQVEHERPNIYELYKELKKGNPVLVTYSAPGAAIGHAVLITAMKGYFWKNKIYASQIVVRDPWPSFVNRLNKGYKIFDATSFLKTVYAHWIISLEAAWLV